MPIKDEERKQLAPFLPERKILEPIDYEIAHYLFACKEKEQGQQESKNNA